MRGGPGGGILGIVDPPRGRRGRKAGTQERKVAMPKKKPMMYGDMAKELAEIQRKMAGERERMARVMCEGLLTGEAAEALGYYSDADLRRVMGYIAEDMGTYVERLEAEKAARARAREARAARAVPGIGRNGTDGGNIA